MAMSLVQANNQKLKCLGEVSFDLSLDATLIAGEPLSLDVRLKQF